MNFKYCDELPQIPTSIIEEVYLSLNTDNLWGKPNSSIYTIHQSKPKLVQWILKYFEKDYVVRVQKIRDDVYPHLDSNRTYVFNYLVETGGDKVLTHFHNTKKDIIESYQIEPNRWHRLNVSQIHSVSGVTSDRIAITVFKRDFTKADLSLYNLISLLS
jgi:hypothetical protein